MFFVRNGRETDFVFHGIFDVVNERIFGGLLAAVHIKRNMFGRSRGLFNIFVKHSRFFGLSSRKNARNMKLVLKLLDFNGIFKFWLSEQKNWFNSNLNQFWKTKFSCLLCEMAVKRIPSIDHLSMLCVKKFKTFLFLGTT